MTAAGASRPRKLQTGGALRQVSLGVLPPRIGTADTRRLKPPPKRADPELLTEQYRAWRAEVLRRAGYRCQWIEHGQRCTKAAPHHRVFADHVVEREDGGALLDLSNGQCLCGSHHTTKTAGARAKRRG
jgi:5-methylcytosine-specific restriction protein A